MNEMEIVSKLTPNPCLRVYQPTDKPALPTMLEKTKHEKLISNFIYEKG